MPATRYTVGELFWTTLPSYIRLVICNFFPELMGWLPVKIQGNFWCILFCAPFFSSLAITLIRARFLQPYKSCCFTNNCNFLLSHFHTVKPKLGMNVSRDWWHWFAKTCCELHVLFFLRLHSYKNSHKTCLFSERRFSSSYCTAHTIG